jgi:isoquinoline 1-oxidoreductase alpha subunit
MAIAGLLRSSAAPSEEAIAALPNICRCGAYPRIKRAIARAAAASRPEVADPNRLISRSSSSAQPPVSDPPASRSE